MKKGNSDSRWTRFRHVAGDKLIRSLSQFSQVNANPIFLLGNQKSGTTVIASLLAKHGGLSSTIDFHYPSAVLLFKVLSGEWSMEEFVRRRAWHFSRDLIKEPGLTYLYEPLSKLFPKGQFVMVLRDPRDNIRSLLNRLRIPGNLDEIGALHLSSVNPIWQKILMGEGIKINDLEYAKNYIDVLSLRWNDIAGTYLNYIDNFYLMRYEDFCIDKTRSISDLAMKLGLPQENDISEDVNTQYGFKGKQEISFIDFYGYSNLEIIHSRCGSYMNQLGYDNV